MNSKPQRMASEGNLQRILESVREPFRRCDFQQCVKIMERARRLAPNNTGVLLDLGTFHLKARNYPAAEECFENAIRAAGEKTKMMATAGLRCSNSQRYDLAECFLRRAVAQQDALPEHFIKLAEIYERRHELNQAGQCIERALHVDPNCGAAMLIRARLSRQRGNLEEAEQILRSIPPGTNREVQLNVSYELGGILDRQGRYDEAMSTFVAAKAAFRSEAAAYRTKWRAGRPRVSALQKGLTEQRVKRWLGARKDFEAEHRIALLGGHPRSGTTVLEQMLDSHPEIVSAEETDVFHCECQMPMMRKLPEGAPLLAIVESPDKGMLQQLRKNYFSSMTTHLDRPLEDKLLVDKNPLLTSVLPAVIRVFPEIKLIVALRDPRDICVSRFTHNVSLDNFSSAFLEFEDIVEMYAELMGLWLTLKPWLENYIEVRYEDMVEGPESVSRKTLEFLGMTWDERVLQFHEHARKKVIHSPTYAEAARPIFKTAKGRWRNYEKYLEPHLARLEPFLRAFGYA